MSFTQIQKKINDSSTDGKLSIDMIDVQRYQTTNTICVYLDDTKIEPSEIKEYCLNYERSMTEEWLASCESSKDFSESQQAEKTLLIVCNKITPGNLRALELSLSFLKKTSVLNITTLHIDLDGHDKNDCGSILQQLIHISFQYNPDIKKLILEEIFFTNFDPEHFKQIASILTKAERLYALELIYHELDPKLETFKQFADFINPISNLKCFGFYCALPKESEFTAKDWRSLDFIFSRVTKLNIRLSNTEYGIDLDNEIIDNIFSLSAANLIELELNGWQLFDQDIGSRPLKLISQKLAPEPKLKILDMRNNASQEEEAVGFSSEPRKIQNFEFFCKNFLVQQTQIEVLNLSDNPVHCLEQTEWKIFGEALCVLPNLKTIGFSGWTLNHMTEQNWQAFLEALTQAPTRICLKVIDKLEEIKLQELVTVADIDQFQTTDVREIPQLKTIVSQYIWNNVKKLPSAQLKDIAQVLEENPAANLGPVNKF